MDNSLIKLGGVLIALIAVFFAYKRHQAIQNWPSTEGTVIAAEIDKDSRWVTKHHSDGSTSKRHKTTYELEVEYRYSVNGKSYTGEDESNEQDRRSYLESRLGEYSTGAKVTVKYDPEDPEDSVLQGL